MSSRIWVGESVAERWDAVKPNEKEAFLFYGLRPAPGESPPDYAERILKADPKITLESGAKVANVFRTAYDGLATPNVQAANHDPRPSDAFVKCLCGCGQDTNPARMTAKRRGTIKGEPQRYVIGHGGSKHPPVWDLMDRGYLTPCWIWRGEQDKLGYAKRGGKYVHREMWKEQHGQVPDGMELDHLCRVPACVKPDHLEPVTHAENIRRGANAKINYEIAEKIRSEQGTSRAIGQRYGLHHSSIQKIQKGQTWT